MNKCSFENLPKYKIKTKDGEQTKIDWKGSIGYLIPFQFKDLIGEFKVVDYNSKKQQVVLEYKGETYTIATSQLLSCSLGGLLGFHNREHIYKKNQILSHNGQGRVLDTFRKNGRHYRIECLQCGNVYERSESHLKDRGAKCPICGDGISYPTKFINSVLLQIKCSFKKEYILKNVKNKRYDFYIEDINTIIEVHGAQHYEKTFGNRTLKEEQENDKLKEELAYQNGVRHYIVIDARKSNIEWIKNSVLNSKLSEFFNLSEIDWEECHKFAVGSITHKICSLFKEDDPNIATKIAKEMGIARGTVVRHLKRGEELGWCNYDPSKIQTLNGQQKSKLRNKPIVCLENGLEFASIAECGRVSEEVFGVKLSPSKIALVCNGVNKTHKGYTFKFKNSEDARCPKTFKNELALRVCEAKATNENLLTTDLAKMFNIGRDRVRDYLIKGSKMGLCNYNPEAEQEKGYVRYLDGKSLKKVEVFRGGISLGLYSSVKVLAEASMKDFGVELNQGSIRGVCLGKRKSYKGYTFKYIEIEEE